MQTQAPNSTDTLESAFQAAWLAMSEAARRDVLAATVNERIPRGGIVDGTPANRMCFVLDGRLKLYYRRPTREPADVMASLLGPGDFFAAGYYPNTGRTMLAEASTNSKLVTVDFDTARRLVWQHPDFSYFGTLALIRVTESLGRRVEALLMGDASARVAWALEDLLLRFGAPDPDGTVLGYRVTQADLAQLCGVTRETVNKTMSEFVSKGWLSKRGHTIVVHDRDGLRRLAG